MDLLREKQRARGHHRAMGGGDSSSASTQNTDYRYSDSRSVTSTDNRTYADNKQDNRVLNDSSRTSTNITTTDGGAVAAGSAVSVEALKQNSLNTLAMFSVAEKLFAGTANIMQANTNLAESLSANATQAYGDATAQATGNKTMMLAGLAVVGVVGVMAFGKN